MFSLSSYSIFFLLFGMSQAHTNQICTSTGGTGSVCGSAKFILTTYHSCPGSGQVPGQLHIQTPTGDIHTFRFTSYCPMSGFSGPGPGGSPLPNQCSQELKDKCGNNNAYVTCYYKPNGVNMIPTQGQATVIQNHINALIMLQ